MEGTIVIVDYTFKQLVDFAVDYTYYYYYFYYTIFFIHRIVEASVFLMRSSTRQTLSMRSSLLKTLQILTQYSLASPIEGAWPRILLR